MSVALLVRKLCRRCLGLDSDGPLPERRERQNERALLDLAFTLLLDLQQVRSTDCV